MSIEDLQRDRLKMALGMSIPDLTAIANGAPPKYGVDTLMAVMALQIKGPAEKAARAQQAQQQPKPPTIKDQVVAEATDIDRGLGALPIKGVMTPKALAAGGIVAFDEGGRVPTQEELQAAYREWIESKGPWYLPTPRGAEDRIRRKEEAYNRLLQAFQAGRPLSGLPTATTPAAPVRPVSAAQQPPTTAAPAAAPAADQKIPDTNQKQPPGGVGFSGVNKAMTNLRGLYGEVDAFDPMRTLMQFEAGPYGRFLPKTADEIRAQRAEAEAELRKMYPESREAAEEMMAKRYAGLEEMYKKREARGAEELKIAEKEKGQTAGIGLMQLASELVTKPLQRIDTSAAFQTFKDANKDFRQARKDFNASKDKIDEARELQKIGQFEKADALYREGIKGVFDFKTRTDDLANAQDIAHRSGLMTLGGKAVQAQADNLARKIELGTKEVDIALGQAKIQGDENVARIHGASRFGAGRSAIEDKAQDNAKARMDQWMKSPAGAFAMAKDQTGNVLIQMQNQFYLEELAKLQGTAAPSGGGAGPTIDFRTGKPLS